MNDTQITYKCPTCWTEYTVDAKYQKQVDAQIKLGYCKFCHRKDPIIPTTAEMDKLLTVEDMRNRFQVMIQCEACRTWNKMKKGENKPCTSCDSTKYDGSTIRSFRTWSPELGKRKKKTKAQTNRSG